MPENPILWRPSPERARASFMYAFMRKHGFDTYASLHDWSITERDAFWQSLSSFVGLQFSKEPQAVLEEAGDMLSARWFRGAEFNYAEQLLREDHAGLALVFCGENGARQGLSYAALRNEVNRIAAGLRAVGVSQDDRVAGFLPNCPEAVIGMLATVSIGAVWSSCSPDFGINGVVDRFGQITPKVLICADGYFYGGKTFDSIKAVDGVVEKIAAIQKVVVVPFTKSDVSFRDARYQWWDEFAVDGAELEFVQLPFDHPLFVMYSSGTTGAPKCIVHGAGGTLIQHQKEHILHCDIHAGDRLFYFTTCGWMMWNWLVSGLASGATLVLFDGAPFHDDGRMLWRIAEQERVSVFGTSAKYITAQEKAGICPRNEFDLSSVRSVLSTGSPLAPASFDYVYREVSADIQLSSISGGTDIISCFAGGNPVLPVRRGELQCLMLGMAVEIFDDNGNAVVDTNGELVCTKSFPSMPIGFWNDPDARRYRAAYFERFPGVWAHGDFAEVNAAGGMLIHGRSDAVLNPGGVRIGTAEIYRQVEKLDEVVESIAVGQNLADDVRVVLFVVLREGVDLDNNLRNRIKAVIRENTTPRHVPAVILDVAEIPRTISGKIVEVAVRAVIHGDAVKNIDALANPQALQYFANRPELDAQ